jgi:hypothetical protein
MPKQNQGSVKGRRIVLGLAILVAAGVAYACWPRQADLRTFDPAEMARLETAMWRDYYEKHYPQLFYHLYESSRTQFGFSPLASVRISLSAALAAKTFQPTRSRGEAEAAIPYLVTYYELLRKASATFDAREVASRELDWWQARREAQPPRVYGVSVAEVAAPTYGKAADDPALLAFGMGRAEAMAYRDARGQTITAQDWTNIETRLRAAYEQLRAAISG